MALSVSGFPEPLRPVSPEHDDSSLLGNSPRLRGLFGRKPDSKPSSRQNTLEDPVLLPPHPLTPALGNGPVFASHDDHQLYAQVPLHRPEALPPIPVSQRQQQVNLSRRTPPPVGKRPSLDRLGLGSISRVVPGASAHALPIPPTQERSMKPSEPSFSSPRPLPAVPSVVSTGPIIESSKTAALRAAAQTQAQKQQQRPPQSKVILTTAVRSHGQPAASQALSVRYQSLAVEPSETEGASSSSSSHAAASTISAATCSTNSSTATLAPASPTPNTRRPLPRIPPTSAAAPTSAGASNPHHALPRHVSRSMRAKRPKTSPSSSAGFGSNVRSPFDAVPSSWASRPVDLHPTHPVATAPPQHIALLSAAPVPKPSARPAMYRTRSRSHTRTRRDRSADVSRIPPSPVHRPIVNRTTVSASAFNHHASPSRAVAGSSAFGASPSRSSTTSAVTAISAQRASQKRLSTYGGLSGNTPAPSRHSSSGSATNSTPTTSPRIGLSPASSNRYLNDIAATSSSSISPPPPPPPPPPTVPSKEALKISEEAAAILWGDRARDRSAEQQQQQHGGNAVRTTVGIKPATAPSPGSGKSSAAQAAARVYNSREQSMSPPRPRPQLPRLHTPTSPPFGVTKSNPELSGPAAATIPEVAEVNGSVESPSDGRIFVDDADYGSLLSRSPSPIRYARPSSRGSTGSSFSSPRQYRRRDSYDYGYDDPDEDQDRFSYSVHSPVDTVTIDDERQPRSRTKRRGRTEQLRAYRKSYRPPAKQEVDSPVGLERSPSPIRYAKRGSFGAEGYDEELEELDFADDADDVDGDDIVGLGPGGGRRHVQPRSYQYDFAGAPQVNGVDGATVINANGYQSQQQQQPHVAVELIKSPSASTNSSKSSHTKRPAAEISEQQQGRMKLKFKRSRSGSPAKSKLMKDKDSVSSSGAGTVIDITFAGLSLGLGRKSNDSGDRPRADTSPNASIYEKDRDKDKDKIRKGWMLAARKSQSQSNIDFDPRRMSAWDPNVVKPVVVPSPLPTTANNSSTSLALHTPSPRPSMRSNTIIGAPAIPIAPMPTTMPTTTAPSGVVVDGSRSISASPSPRPSYTSTPEKSQWSDLQPLRKMGVGRGGSNVDLPNQHQLGENAVVVSASVRLPGRSQTWVARDSDMAGFDGMSRPLNLRL